MKVYEEKKYTPGQSVVQAQQALQQHQAVKPGQYQSQWQGKIDGLLGQIQNRPNFSYDINADAMYQQVLQNYIQQGQQAMMDTMGQTTALTGGYANSYAQNAGQQAYQGYLKGAHSQMPQFFQMALDKYKMEGDQLMQQLGVVQDQEQKAYGRYMDAMNMYLAEQDRLQGIYENERNYDYDRWADDRDFGYGKHRDELEDQYRADRDKVSDEQWLQQWQYQQERDKIKDEQWQKEYEESVRQYNESMAWQREQAAKRSSGGGGGSRGGSGGSGSSGWGSGISEQRNQGGIKGSGWDYTKHNIQQLVNRGDMAGLDKYMSSVVDSKGTTLADQMSEKQYNEVMNIINKKKR